ncbi:hypothetical protein RJ40_05960 [Methanofollis aquaemaris]|uniref:CARDB domain-containing protein n=1 Tax=Methanofollis aquaemaris TaxID=126734 RepID=A0A8A3S5R6_9EURY|nr:hypothetical protein [Methanofollis aquaemaris]QSZ67071.1 hypothetical protein RJ40_05960 [Methanofollis aquaemaris]
MDMKITPLFLLFVSVIAVVLTGGCTDSSLSEGDTHLHILDVGAEDQSMSSIDTYMTVKNTGSTTAHNIVVAVITLPESDVSSALESTEILKITALNDSQNEDLMLDRDFVDALGPGETIKIHLSVNPDDLSDGWDVLRVAFADNAEVVYSEPEPSSSLGVQPGNTPYTTTPPVPSAPLSEPAYAIGDVISYEQDSDVAEVILDYDAQNDAYKTDVIFKWDEYDTGEYGWYPYSAPAGTWGYRLESNDSSWTDRTCIEKSCPYVLGHADSIALREDYD